MEYQMPVDHLEATLDAALSVARALRRPAAHLNLAGSLRHSLRVFVRSELTRTLRVAAEPHLLPELLQRHVPIGFEVSRSALDALMCRRASQWCASIKELLARLEQDWPQTEKYFDLSSDASLVAVTPPLGDPHNDGRAVYRAIFSDGKSLIYKPRSVETEHAFATILQSLDDSGCQPRFRSCLALPKDGYGWTKYCPTTFCETSEQITAFYHRQGGFLALFWLLCADDAIEDNVVVSGEHPVWVDLECLSRPDLGDLRSAHKSFPLWIRESTLLTAMVVYGGNGVGPLGHFRGHTGLYVSCARERDCAFTPDDVLRTPYLRAVICGFQEVYRWFLSHDGALSLERGPLAVCRGRHVRVLLRATGLYDLLAKVMAITPEASRSDVSDGIREVLRIGDPRTGGPFPEEIVAAEMQALARGDIPYWSTSMTSHDLWDTYGTIVHAVASDTCLECIERRAARMSEADLARQSWLLESLLAGKGMVEAH